VVSDPLQCGYGTIQLDRGCLSWARCEAASWAFLGAAGMETSILDRVACCGLVFAILAFAHGPAEAETPADYGCDDRPITLAYYEFGPLYHDGVGIDRDVVEELAKRSGCRFETSLRPRAEIWQQLQAGTLDMTTSGLRTEARNQFAHFVPYLGLKNVLITAQAQAAEIQSFDDVVGDTHLKIGVVKGFILGAYFDFRLKNAGSRVIGYPDQNAIYDALRRDEVQAIVSPAFNYEYFFKAPEERAAFVMIDVSPAPPVAQNMIFSRHRFSDAEINAWTRLLEQMRLDGTLERICRAQVSPEMTRVLLNY
jgi:polar amino acid transport system substrate-binding protein